MVRFAVLLVVAVGLSVSGPPAEAGSNVKRRKKTTKPLAKLVKGRILLLQKIQFSSWRVRPASYPVLKSVARILRKRPKLVVRIEAHSDSRGSARFNQRVTQRRAEELKKALVKLGIKARRLQAVGRGEAYPIASNRTAAGRRKNRRVELVVIPRKRKRRP